MNIRQFRFPGIFPQFYRITVLTLFCLALLGYAVQHEETFPLRMRLPSSSSVPAESSPKISTAEILEQLNANRIAQGLPELQTNTSLEKAARLLSLEMEDSQTMEIPENVRPFLSAVSTSLPPEIETFAVFLTGLGNLDQGESLASSSALSSRKFTEVGISQRTATFEETRGTLVVVMASPPFANTYEKSGSEAKPPTVSAQPPTYTGQDLWMAVQNYRRAHSLFEFKQANELCTVASIRVNELIELGRLDNHDGFGPRADEFFERNPDWTAINENLASGYDTAIQAVEWGWDQSLGHQALLKSTEYPYACTAANQGYAVLITGK
jgi:uncharacterized protein YkwD